MQIEGRRPVIEALRAGRDITEIVVAEGTKSSAAIDEIRALATDRGVPVRALPRRQLEERARSRNPQGVIAVAARSGAALEDLLAHHPALVVALDGVTDPQNAGAIARSAEALGADGLVLPERRSAGRGEGMERAAAGALSHLPLIRVTNLARALDAMKQDGMWTVALDAEGQTTIDDLALADQRLCLVIGDEGKGVSRLVRERADLVASIPLTGKVESLNASAAAAIALFEIARQRP